jgi:hypothetical protein
MAERIDTPGAAICGLTSPPNEDGPRDAKLAIVPFSAKAVTPYDSG